MVMDARALVRVLARVLVQDQAKGFVAIVIIAARRDVKAHAQVHVVALAKDALAVAQEHVIVVALLDVRKHARPHVMVRVKGHEIVLVVVVEGVVRAFVGGLAACRVVGVLVHVRVLALALVLVHALV